MSIVVEVCDGVDTGGAMVRSEPIDVDGPNGTPVVELDGALDAVVELVVPDDPLAGTLGDGTPGDGTFDDGRLVVVVLVVDVLVEVVLVEVVLVEVVVVDSDSGRLMI